MSVLEQIQPAQRTAFKNLILQHIQRGDPKRWRAFRKLAKCPGQVAGGPSIPADVDPSALVRLATSADDMPLSAVRRVRGVWQTIGEIEGSPILFNTEAGIYAWAPAAAEWTLQLWLTSPAYPPGWD